MTLFPQISKVELIKKTEMKKIISFLALCLSFIGAIGGIGYAIYGGAWPVAIGVGVLAYTAWPELKKYANALIM